MKKIGLLSLIFFIISFPVLSQTISGKVVRIADGDTFTLLDSTNTQVKVRLYGIDCPERAQAYSQVATKFLSDQIFGKVVRVEVKDIDRYKRTVGIVFIDTVNVNIELIKNGLAWHYRQYCKDTEYAEAEKQAKELKLGLWKDKNPVAPWEFRRNK